MERKHLVPMRLCVSLSSWSWSCVSVVWVCGRRWVANDSRWAWAGKSINALSKKPSPQLCKPSCLKTSLPLHYYPNARTQSQQETQGTRHGPMTPVSFLLRQGTITAARTRLPSTLASSLPAAVAAPSQAFTHARCPPLFRLPSSLSSSFQRRSVFTYPAPRKLTDIMKVPLVRKCEPAEIKVRREGEEA